MHNFTETKFKVFEEHLHISKRLGHLQISINKVNWLYRGYLFEFKVKNKRKQSFEFVWLHVHLRDLSEINLISKPSHFL